MLEVRDLKKHFQTAEGRVRAVDGVSFTVKAGETLGLVGESGSGKTTVAYMIAGLHPPTDGRILFGGHDIGGVTRSRSLRRQIQIVFQDPGTSLNPTKSIKEILSLPFRVHRLAAERQLSTKVWELLDYVHLPSSYMYKYPRELSEGEKQAVGIARALAVNPSLIVLDEPTSALDVSMQAWILRLLLELQEEFGFSYLLITHDLSLMRNFATRVAIMYLGQIREVASASAFFSTPRHPYTQMLISSIPVITQEEEQIKPERIISQGEIPSPVNVPTGCRFNPRCSERMDVCVQVDPAMVELGEAHCVACHLYPPEEIEMQAVATGRKG